MLHNIALLCSVNLALALIFYVVFIICEFHLVPAVEVFIKQYKIPEEVAAVTLVAFGSACPELILNVVSAQEDESSLSQPALLGSGMIAFGLIPVLALAFSPYPAMRLKLEPILRENGFYIASLMIFLYINKDGVTSLFEALLLLSVYGIYLAVVIIGTRRKMVKGAGSPVEKDSNQEEELLIGIDDAESARSDLVDSETTGDSSLLNAKQNKAKLEDLDKDVFVQQTGFSFAKCIPALSFYARMGMQILCRS